MKEKRLLAICHSFAPEVTPTAIRSGKLLERLGRDWQIDILTGTPNNQYHYAKGWYPTRLIGLLHKFKLSKIVEWLVWPDDAIFWVVPGLLQGRKLVKQNRPDALIAFMMPYSAGLVGIALKWLTGLPLILNFDDSPTCDHVHPYFHSRLHYWLTRALEDFYIRQADKVIYVSEITRRRVKNRQPNIQQLKLELIRYGADPSEFQTQPLSKNKNEFEIVYIGGMSGWFDYYHSAPATGFKKLYQSWMRWGRYQLAQIDRRGSSPVTLAHAIENVTRDKPEWVDKVKIRIYGNKYPQDIIERVLQNEKIEDLVSVSGPVSHAEAIKLAANADLLLIALADRPGEPPGGIISAKTYEYLMTDRAILAAVPPGENWNYLAGKPGVWLVQPTDLEAMTRVLNELLAAKAAGYNLSYDRRALHHELDYNTRAGQLSVLLDEVLASTSELAVAAQ